MCERRKHYVWGREAGREEKFGPPFHVEVWNFPHPFPLNTVLLLVTDRDDIFLSFDSLSQRSGLFETIRLFCAELISFCCEDDTVALFLFGLSSTLRALVSIYPMRTSRRVEVRTLSRKMIVPPHTSQTSLSF